MLESVSLHAPLPSPSAAGHREHLPLPTRAYAASLRDRLLIATVAAVAIGVAGDVANQPFLSCSSMSFEATRAPSVKDVLAAVGPSDSAFQSLLSAVRAEPVERGFSHSAEHALEQFIEAYGARAVTSRMFSHEQAVADVSDIIQLLGRLTDLTDIEQLEVVKHALASADLQVRDSAIRAAENWGSRALMLLLDAHIEPVAWLAEYVAQVVVDLRG